MEKRYEIWKCTKMLPNGKKIQGKQENRKFVQNLKSKTKNPTSKNLIMQCVNRKGWRVYIKHIDAIATIIIPVENPIKVYNPILENIKITTDDEIRFWYDSDDINRGLNIKPSTYFEGYTSASLDLRETVLGRKLSPNFGMSVKTYNTFKKNGRLEELVEDISSVISPYKS